MVSETFNCDYAYNEYVTLDLLNLNIGKQMIQIKFAEI